MDVIVELTATRPKRRDEQRDATRASLLEASVETLIERGVASTTTLEVQQRAGVSRGALLHHFPTHAALLAATVTQLVRRNEANVREAVRTSAHVSDPLDRAILVLANTAGAPASLAEFELWAVSRTDDRLRTALREIERAARAEQDRVLMELFGSIEPAETRTKVIALSVEFARGLALSNILRADTAGREKLLHDWTALVRTMLTGESSRWTA